VTSLARMGAFAWGLVIVVGVIVHFTERAWRRRNRAR